MPHATASAPSNDLHAAYLDYLRRTGRGNPAYYWAARVFFGRWPDPQQWAAEPLEVRLSAGTSTRPVITFLMLHRALRPGYDYLLERKLSTIWREIADSPLAPDLDAFMTAAAGLGFTRRVRFATGSQVPARLLIQTGRHLHQLTVTDLAPSPRPAGTGSSAPARATTTISPRSATPSGSCSTSGSSMSCPAQAARSRSPNASPGCGRRSAPR